MISIMDKKKELVIGTVLVLIFVVGIIVAWPAKKTQTTAPQVTTTETNVTESATQEYTMTEVGKHNSTSNCWLAINGGVYDATAYASRHPGGASLITDYCGTDASSLYNEERKHGGKASLDLESLLVGDLKNE